MSPIIRIVLVLALLCPWLAACQSQPAGNAAAPTAGFPGGAWMQLTDLAEAGWSTQKLAAAQTYADSIGSAAVMLVQHGLVVAAWGQVDRRFMAHSIRKSFLSALIGMQVDSGQIDMHSTLADLGIDDLSPLSEIELQASVADLLTARSGVYLPAAYESPAWAKRRPERGAHLPGEFWYYNNWDFNALDTIYEQQSGESLFAAFDRRIARPLGMQDFRLRDGNYLYQPERSRHPAYLFRISARDLARFGLLYLQRGAWRGEQIVPAAWVDASTQAHADTGLGSSYGYLWWLPHGDLAAYGAYYASGAGAQILMVLPELDMVFVHLTDTYQSDQGDEDQVMRLLAMLLEARGEAPPGGYATQPLETPQFPYRAVELPLETLQGYAGEYVYPGGQSIRVFVQDGGLEMDFGYGVFDLLPLSENEFLVVDTREHLRFTHDEKGHLQLDYQAEGANLMRAVITSGPAVLRVEG